MKKADSALTITEITLENLFVCVDIFIAVFREEPWCEQWDRKTVEQRLLHFFESRGFYGFTAYRASEPVGLILGNSEPWTGYDHFYLREFVVKKNQQGSGVGKALLRHLSACLKAKNVRVIYLATILESRAFEFYYRNKFDVDESVGFLFKRL